MGEKIADLLVEFLFSALYKVSHSSLPKAVRWAMVLVICLLYGTVLLYLVQTAIRTYGEGNYYLCFLSVTATVVFILLIIAGYRVHGKDDESDEED